MWHENYYITSLLILTSRVIYLVCACRSGFSHENPNCRWRTNFTTIMGHCRTGEVSVCVFTNRRWLCQWCTVSLMFCVFPRFRSIAKSYFRRADGVLLLYDVTCERSFLNVREWVDMIEVTHPYTVLHTLSDSHDDHLYEVK